MSKWSMKVRIQPSLGIGAPAAAAAARTFFSDF
jgi:hypothetical protein